MVNVMKKVTKVGVISFTFMAFVEPWMDVFNIAIDAKGAKFDKIRSVIMIFEIEK